MFKKTEDYIKDSYGGMETARGTTTAHEEGQKKAGKGQYHNPYSFASQKQLYLDFEAGWKSKQGEMNPDQVTTRLKYSPQLAVLILGILLAFGIYLLNS